MEIKNRLDHLDQKSPRELIDTNAVVELDDIAASVSDWHAQYPQDPWLPHTYGRLLRTYERAGASSSDRAVACFGEMEQAYPDAPDTADVAMIYGDAPSMPVASAPVLPQAPDPVAVAPSYAAPAYVPVVVAAQPVVVNSNAWARFGSLRGNGYQAPQQSQPAAYYQAPPPPARSSTNVTVNVTVNGHP